MSSNDNASTKRDGNNPFDAALNDFADLYQCRWSDARVDRSGEQLRISSATKLRPNPGNHPKVFHHGKKTDDVIVLIHGITDSPYYVEAIGRRLFGLGFNVVLPLLPAHGLLEPWPAMRALEHLDWVHDIDRVAKIAKGIGRRLSIGGFSTGGALAVHHVIRHRDVVTGGIYLFSAALDIGDHKETILESFAGEAIGRTVDIANFLKSTIREKFSSLRKSKSKEQHDNNYGIGADPCKYDVFFYEGVSELAEVIDEIDDYFDAHNLQVYSDIEQPCFVAHSRADTAALFVGAERFYNNHPNDERVCFFQDDIKHSSLVLEKPILDNDEKVIVTENPDFKDMMEAMEDFTRRYVAVS